MNCIAARQCTLQLVEILKRNNSEENSISDNLDISVECCNYHVLFYTLLS